MNQLDFSELAHANKEFCLDIVEKSVRSLSCVKEEMSDKEKLNVARLRRIMADHNVYDQLVYAGKVSIIGFSVFLAKQKGYNTTKQVLLVHETLKAIENGSCGQVPNYHHVQLLKLILYVMRELLVLNMKHIIPVQIEGDIFIKLLYYDLSAAESLDKEPKKRAQILLGISDLLVDFYSLDPADYAKSHEKNR